MHPSLLELGQHHLKLAITNQRVSTDDGQVERLVLVDQREQVRDELIALIVGELTQLGRATQMRGVKGIASGATQRAFLRDLD